MAWNMDANQEDAVDVVWPGTDDVVLLEWADLKDSADFKRVLSSIDDLTQLCQYVQTLYVNRMNQETPPVEIVGEETFMKHRLIRLNLEVRAHTSQKVSAAVHQQPQCALALSSQDLFACVVAADPAWVAIMKSHVRAIVMSPSDAAEELSFLQVRSELEQRMGHEPGSLRRLRSVINKFRIEAIEVQRRALALRAKEARSNERPKILTVRDPNAPPGRTTYPQLDSSPRCARCRLSRASTSLMKRLRKSRTGSSRRPATSRTTSACSRAEPLFTVTRGACVRCISTAVKPLFLAACGPSP